MNRKLDGARSKFSYKMSGWKHSAGVRLLLFFFFAVLFYISMADRLVPQTYDIKLGAVSEREIKASEQIEDKKATVKAQEDAAQKVQPIFTIVSMRNEIVVDQIFDRLEQLNADDEVSYDSKVNIYRNEIPGKIGNFTDSFIRNNKSNINLNATLLEELKKRVDEQQYTIPEETFYKLPKLSAAEIAEMRPVTSEIVMRLMNDQINDAQTARARVAELVNASTLSKKAMREIVQEIARYAITPNRFFDEESTQEARDKARENTQPVYIKKNDIVVDKGEVITQDIYDRLDALKLLKDKVSYWPQFGLFILVLLFTLVLFMFMRQSSATSYPYHNGQLLMLLLIFIVNIFAMKIVELAQSDEYPYIGFITPLALGSMLVTLLMDGRIAYVSTILFAVIASIVLNMGQDQIFDFRYGFVALVVSFASMFAIHRASQRSTILKAGIMVCLFGALSIMSLLMLEDQVNRQEVFYSLGFTLAGGLLTVILVIGLMPFFELTFGILSALKLVELSNPNHPLLRKLLKETPGTYHHSVMVGNLSEAAAESVGANGLLCRVGSFYHDIGKTKRPSYFIENQTNIENPHDFIEPKLSKSIIVAHARDGVEMLKDHRLPKPIRDIAEQHHGTTLLKYFYVKALKQAEEQGVEPDFTEEDYRYPGPKAQSKEAAIVGIADCVEAAVRSLRNPTVEHIENMIQKIIKSRLDDQQFNECDLTMKELDTIAQSLKETVIGIFHSRIEYPEDIAKKTDNKDNKGEQTA